jgi:Holliday junction resolvasome RuvABC endonuclease subunit
MSVKVKAIGGLTKSKTIYMGIDQSYSGFAITYLGEDSDYQTSVAKFDLMGVQRLATIQDYILNSIHIQKEYGRTIKAIAMEGYAFGSQMANMLGELGATVKLALLKANLPNNASFPYIVPPTSLKKYATGKGNTQKNQMLLSVYKKWGIEFRDDNAADSYALAHLVSGKYKTDYEQEVYEKILTAEYREL